jgi:hypothetical protein
MTKKLEELFDLAPSVEKTADPTPQPAQDLRSQLQILDENIDKVDAALPGVRGLESSDEEMDGLAELAKDSYKDLMDLGMQVDSQDSPAKYSQWPATCWGMLSQQKQPNWTKKLKMIDLQMKKMRLDQQQQVLDAKAADAGGGEAMQTAQGMVLSRNDLLERILGKDQNDKKE